MSALERNPDAPSPAEQGDARESLLVVRREAAFGPLPDPVTFQQYDAVLPGAAERILAMAEQNAQHGREMDKAILQAQVELEKDVTKTQRLGQLYGLAVTAAVLGVTVYALAHGHEIAAAILGGTTIVGLVAVFVRGREKQPPQAAPVGQRPAEPNQD